MKRYLIFLLLTGMPFISPFLLNAQWIQTNGPLGGSTRSLTSVSDILFVGTGAGVFRSIDNGNLWVPTQLMDRIVVSFTLSNDGDPVAIQYAGTMHGGVYLSADKWENWQQVIVGL